jgi:tetratricopeptide (TPR) repeat protein
MRFDHLEFEESEKSEPRLEHSAVVRAEDHDEHYWLKTASTDRRNGMHELALRHYSRALEMDKSLVTGWVGQVQMLIALAEYPEAELWSRKALELFKNNAELLASRGQALCRMGDLKNARANCDAAINQQGSNSLPWVARGELMLARKEAIDVYCFDKASQLDGDWLLLLEIGAIYLHYGQSTKALQRTRTAVEKAPDQAYCWYREGICEMALGLDRAAEKSFGRCLQLEPKHPRARDSVLQLHEKHRGFFGFVLHRLFRSSN